MRFIAGRRGEAPAGARGMARGLRTRLLVLLMAPLLLLALLNAWLDYRGADNVAEHQDERLLALVPLLASSVIAPAVAPQPLVLLLPPSVDEFLRGGKAAFAIVDPDGNVLRGEPWLGGLAPSTPEPEFHTEENAGTTWRIVRQRQQTVTGDLTMVLADGTDPRQQWARSILLKVLLPNLALLAAAAFSVQWAVERALRPLLALRDDLERRSPRDLSPIDAAASPEEVRPLVASLNRLFALVNAQAEGQRRFIADAAHQLRTPLAGLQAQVEAWAQAAASGSDGQVRLPASEVAKLQGATRRTTQLANQLLALSRADAAMQAQPVQPVDVKALCEDILQDHLDAASAKEIDLGLDAAPLAVTGHGWLLRELLANLVDNAVKYTPAGGTVTIRCARRGDTVELEVEDDGPGIAAGDRPRAVERFHRGPDVSVEGSGLGLAIADEIARLHRGALLLREGQGGRGLRVTARLPA